jgi:hypothetical protein
MPSVNTQSCATQAQGRAAERAKRAQNLGTGTSPDLVASRESPTADTCNTDTLPDREENLERGATPG